tara:strand:+ start:225 stop:452 length:228 start_codon:yes stop_codon:yes gene_type:complete
MRSETVCFKTKRLVTEAELDDIIEQNEYVTVEMWWGNYSDGYSLITYTDWSDEYLPSEIKSMNEYIKAAVKKITG